MNGVTFLERPEKTHLARRILHAAHLARRAHFVPAILLHGLGAGRFRWHSWVLRLTARSATADVDQAKPRETARPDSEAQRKLVADLDRVERAAADNFDLERFDREMAAAFRAYGTDLDRVDPQESGARLAGWRSTPEIAAAIDDWCAVRRREPGARSGIGWPGSRVRPIQTRGEMPFATSSTDLRPKPSGRCGRAPPRSRQCKGSPLEASSCWFACSGRRATQQPPRPC